MTIPKEYLESTYDFGFSAIDERDPVPVAPLIETEDVTSPILLRIDNLEVNVRHLMTNTGEILNILERIEQAGSPELDTDEYKQLIEKDVKSRLLEIEKLIIPLLVNLMKNPEKETIKWPNRKPMIEKQVERILALTRC